MIQPTGLSASITPALLTVTGTSVISKVYDGTTTATLINGHLTGVIPGEAVTLNQAGTFASKDAGTGLVVTAADTLSGAAIGNYTLIQPTGLTGTITPAPLTLSITGISKIYDGATTASITLSYTPLAGDIVNVTDTANFLDKNAGTNKQITVTGFTLSGQNAMDYVVTGTTRSTVADITPKTLTVTGTTVADKAYNGNLYATLSHGSLVGLVAGDAITLTQTGKFASQNVGTSIAVTANDRITGIAASNYALIQPTGLSASITPAPLTITVNNVTKTYGDIPTLAGTAFVAAGLKNNETVGSVTLSSAGAASTASVPGGPYSITASDATGGTFASSNYSITYMDGVLTIKPAKLTVTATAATKTYGANDPTLTYTHSALVGADTDAIFFGALDRVSGENVGNYAITLNTLSAGGNYSIVYTGARLTVNPASLSIFANPTSKVVGTADPALTYTYSGFVNNDTASVFSGTLGRVSGETLGNYAITQNTLTAGKNYTITYTGAMLSIFSTAANPFSIASVVRSISPITQPPALPVTTTPVATPQVEQASQSAITPSATSPGASTTSSSSESSPQTSGQSSQSSSTTAASDSNGQTNQENTSTQSTQSSQTSGGQASKAAVNTASTQAAPTSTPATQAAPASTASQPTPATTTQAPSTTATHASSTLVNALSSGSTPEAAVSAATQANKAQTNLSTAQTVAVSPSNQAVAALANQTAGASQTATPLVHALAAAGIDLQGSASPNAAAHSPAGQSLVATLASGGSPDVALSSMTQTSAAVTKLTAAQSVPVSTPNQVAATLSGGGGGASTATALQAAGIPTTTGSANPAGQALVAALASGASPAEAMASAQKVVAAQTALASAQSVPVSSANQAVSTLASGSNPAAVLAAAGGGTQTGNALVAALASGASPAEAMASAQKVAAAQTALSNAQTVPVSHSNQVAASLSSGRNLAAALQSAGITTTTGGGANPAGQALVAALASGASPAEALAAAQKVVAAQTALANAQTVPVSASNQVAANLSSGGNPAAALQAAGITTTPGGANPAGQALVAALASGASPAEALAAAQKVVAAQAALANAQIVPVSQSNQVASALTGGGNMAAALKNAGISADGAAGQTLITALASGQTPEAALAAATKANIAQTTLTIAQTVPMSKSDQLLTALANGADPSGSHSLEKTAALLAALSSGVPLEKAMVASNDNNESLAALAKAQVVPVSPMNQVIGALANSVPTTHLTHRTR